MNSPSANLGPPNITHENGGTNLTRTFDEIDRKESEAANKQRSTPGGRRKRRRKSRSKSRKKRKSRRKRKSLRKRGGRRKSRRKSRR